jgi:predicted membrane protein
MEALVIIFYYIVGVFAAIALSTYLWADELDGKEEVVTFFCLFSWVFVLAIIMGVTWICVIKYPFVRFYNKCKERSKKKMKINGYVAKDKDGSLWFHYIKPHRENDIEKTWWGSNDKAFEIYKWDFAEFDDLTWENEPIEVELIINKI